MVDSELQPLFSSERADGKDPEYRDLRHSRNYWYISVEILDEIFLAANRGLITFSNTPTRDPPEKTSAGRAKEGERKRMGETASKLVRRRRLRRRPTERDKFDFIALLELMLGARTDIGGNGGGGGARRTAQGGAERTGNRAANHRWSADRWFSDGGGKAEQTQTSRWGKRAERERRWIIMMLKYTHVTGRTIFREVNLIVAAI